MRVLIDACVLYPTVLRQIVLGLARTGAFEPLWSDRILEEWARASAKDGALAEDQSRAEIERLRAIWPRALVSPDLDVEAQLSLPDPSDVHVLASAIAGEADELLTLNVRDFPTRTLARSGLIRRHPDEFLLEAFRADQKTVAAVVEGVHDALLDSGLDMSQSAMLKKARLPRLARAMG